MDSERILIDSTIVIEYFRKRQKEKTKLHKLLHKNATLYISAITHYELLCGTKSAELKRDTENLLTLFHIITFGEKKQNMPPEFFKFLKAQIH